MCVVFLMTKYFLKLKKINDTNVCCHEDDKVLLDDTKKIMTQMCVVIKMTKYFWKIKKINDTKVCCHKDDKVLLDD